MKNYKRYWIVFCTLILAAWFFVSFFRTFYNFSKVYTEERQWMFLSDDEKRSKTFGDIYNFLEFIGENTKTHDSILFFFSNKKYFAGTGYLSTYFLYPRQIYFSQFKKDTISIINSKKFDYIVLYWTNNDNSEVQNYFKENSSKLKTVNIYESKNTKGGVFKYE